MTRKIIFIDKRISYDNKYKSPLLGKFINCMMLDGKKSTAEKVVYTALEAAAQKAEMNPLTFFEKIVENSKLQYRILKRKVGANTVQIPHVVDEHKQISMTLLMLKNVIRELQEKSKRSVIECIEDVFNHTFKNSGPVVKKKEEIEQTAIKNRVFSHYSWMSKKIKAKTKTKRSFSKNQGE
jgi:small subunit ribosomal protein S7